MVEDRKGKVYFVGAGPGDPGLLTIKGRDCLSLAQVVIYDNLANEAFLRYAPDQAELIYVGKKGGYHTKSQDEINSLVIDRAHQGCVGRFAADLAPGIFLAGPPVLLPVLSTGVRPICHITSLPLYLLPEKRYIPPVSGSPQSTGQDNPDDHTRQAGC